MQKQPQSFSRQRNEKDPHCLSQSSDLNSAEHAFQLVKTKLKTETHKQAAPGGGCIKGLVEHLKGGNMALADVHGFQALGSYCNHSLHFEHLIV